MQKSHQVHPIQNYRKPNTTKMEPPKLQHLSTKTLTSLLQKSVYNLNRIVAADIRRNFANYTPSKENGREIDKGVAINRFVAAKVTAQMLLIRKYLVNSMKDPELTKITFTPEVSKYIIHTAIETENIGLLRLILTEWTSLIDCRTLKHTQPFQQFQPPDEFDWFSRDKLGKIMRMSEVCEIFSIIGMSQCAGSIQELYMNARRKEYWAAPRMILEICADVLGQMENLTTLVLRGICDDFMMKVIGGTANGLRVLDISGSHFVTDTGLLNLFLKEVKENPAIYLMKSFLEKNTQDLNSLIQTLEILDCSWTNVTSLSRKMVQNFPGAFSFKRIFTSNESFSYGQTVFIRKMAMAQSLIPSSKDNTEVIAQFEKELTPIIGSRGVANFLKISEQHPWKACTLSLYKEDIEDKYFGFIIPNQEERRVHGTVTFSNSALTELYSIFPININLLGEACPKLQKFTGHLTDVWKRSSGILPELTRLEVFADPATITSILESVPSLRSLKIRVTRNPLTDDHLMKLLPNLMCSRTLEELWIAPGAFKASASGSEEDAAGGSEEESSKQKYETVLLNYFAAERLPRDASSDKSEENASCQIEDLVQLSVKFLHSVLTICKRLTRIGDVAWWTPLKKFELAKLEKDFARREKRTITFIWENKLERNDATGVLVRN